MPELPEVETTRRRLRPLVLGQTLRQVVHRDPARYRNTALAEGRRILEVDRRGSSSSSPSRAGWSSWPTWG